MTTTLTLTDEEAVYLSEYISRREKYLTNTESDKDFTPEERVEYDLVESLHQKLHPIA